MFLKEPSDSTVSYDVKPIGHEPPSMKPNWWSAFREASIIGVEAQAISVTYRIPAVRASLRRNSAR